MVYYCPPTLRYHIRLCQKYVTDIDTEMRETQNRPLRNSICNFRETTKDIINFCSRLSLGKKTDRYSKPQTDSKFS